MKKERISLIPVEELNGTIINLFPKDSVLLNFDKVLYEKILNNNKWYSNDNSIYNKRINDECCIFLDNIQIIYNNIKTRNYKNFIISRIYTEYYYGYILKERRYIINNKNNTSHLVSTCASLVEKLAKLHKKYYELSMNNQIKVISDNLYNNNLYNKLSIENIEKEIHTDDGEKWFIIEYFHLLYINKYTYDKIVYNISNNKDKKRNYWLLYNEYIHNTSDDAKNNILLNTNTVINNTATAIIDIMKDSNIWTGYYLSNMIIEEMDKIYSLIIKKVEYNYNDKKLVTIDELIYLWLLIIELSLKLYGKEKM